MMIGVISTSQMNSMLRFVVEDPDRIVHTVEKDNKGVWFGTENLTMHFPEQGVRHVAKLGLLRAMENTLDDHGSWGQFTWIRKD